MTDLREALIEALIQKVRAFQNLKPCAMTGVSAEERRYYGGLADTALTVIEQWTAREPE